MQPEMISISVDGRFWLNNKSRMYLLEHIGIQSSHLNLL